MELLEGEHEVWSGRPSWRSMLAFYIKWGIIALLAGASLLGILGALLAVSTAAIIQVVIQELLDERDRRADEKLDPTIVSAALRE